MGDAELSSCLAISVKVNTVYDRVTVQGEGPFVGRRCTFVRLYGCNLHCRWCDTPETWDTTGLIGPAYSRADNSISISPDDVADSVAALDVDLCVITGGEPMVQQRSVVELAAALRQRGVASHIETNGTLAPDAACIVNIEHFVVSPKLPSAEAGPLASNAGALAVFARLASTGRASFKFVASHTSDIDAAAELCDQLDVTRAARWVMPEGIHAADVQARLQELVEHAMARGFNVSTRLHVQLWGAEKRR